ncbi:hypothetical protein TUM4438_42070 [Shewanella sairae]|uniref:Uncharacterized protein n=1 Tax=Shewanella sairae TaxID=190310 RepID=A0ABQ4PR22_9GAMM|nr:hypothetical protein TUM4438_42070 [Shewanella sairae]
MSDDYCPARKTFRLLDDGQYVDGQYVDGYDVIDDHMTCIGNMAFTLACSLTIKLGYKTL